MKSDRCLFTLQDSSGRLVAVHGVHVGDSCMAGLPGDKTSQAKLQAQFTFTGMCGWACVNCHRIQDHANSMDVYMDQYDGVSGSGSKTPRDEPLGASENYVFLEVPCPGKPCSQTGPQFPAAVS